MKIDEEKLLEEVKSKNTYDELVTLKEDFNRRPENFQIGAAYFKSSYDLIRERMKELDKRRFDKEQKILIEKFKKKYNL